jgi:LPXTG-motif cell wall-anchored protein
MLLVALFVALPASSALAQSAGDNQYQDPLGGGGSQGTTQPSTPSRPAQSGSSGSAAPATPAQAPKATRSVPLARTGFDAWIPAAAGLVLLVGGVALLRTRRTTT